jgi:hypothetical protein
MRQIIQFTVSIGLLTLILFGCESVTQSDISENSDVESSTLAVEGLSNHFVMLNPFTQTELDNNWEADRQFPTDGVTSVSGFGRDNVAQLGINSSLTAPGTFQRTEGIKTVGVGNFGDALQIDLYIDPDWETKAVRAGLWVVDDDGSGERNTFGIIEFVNNESCEETECSNQSNITNHEGFRIWDNAAGWKENLETDFEYGEWVTLGIELDTSEEQYVYYINGEEVGTAVSGSTFIREVFLNSYNYGQDNFPNLSSESYAANWHVGILNPETKNDCKKGGWQEYGFKNQGQCIRFVNTGKDSR